MILRPLDGTPWHVSPGEVIAISYATLCQLDPADIEILGRAPAELAFEI